MKPLLCVLLINAFALHAYAEIYQWKDEDGKVHFLDRHPDSETDAEKVAIPEINIDHSSDELDKVKSVLGNSEPWSDQNKTKQQASTKQAKNGDKKKTYRCSELRRHYDLVRGAVVFVDEDGRSVRRTRREADELAAKYKALLEKEC